MPRQSPKEHNSAAVPVSQGWESRRLNRALATRLLAALDGIAARVVAYPRGQPVLQSSSRPKALPFVESGVLEVVVTVDTVGHRVIPVTFERGEIALLSLLFCEQMAHIDLVAARAARVRWLPRHAMETALYADRDLLLLLVKFLGQRLREAQRREQSWMDRGVRERVIAALSRAARDASPVQAGAIRLSITHEELADRSAVSRPKLSLHLKALERTGVLRLGRGAVEIIDPERLDRERMNRPARAR